MGFKMRILPAAAKRQADKSGGEGMTGDQQGERVAPQQASELQRPEARLGLAPDRG